MIALLLCLLAPYPNSNTREMEVERERVSEGNKNRWQISCQALLPFFPLFFIIAISLCRQSIMPHFTVALSLSLFSFPKPFCLHQTKRARNEKERQRQAEAERDQEIWASLSLFRLLLLDCTFSSASATAAAAAAGISRFFLRFIRCFRIRLNCLFLSFLFFLFLSFSHAVTFALFSLSLPDLLVIKALI